MQFRKLHRTIQIRLLEQFLSGLVNNMVFPFMVIYFSGIFGAALTGVLFGCNVVLGFLAGLYGGSLSDRLGRRAVMLRMETVRLIGTTIMALAASPWLHAPVLMFCMLTINTICVSVSRPAGQAMVIDASTPENRTFIYSLDYWFWNTSVFVGSIIGGYFFVSHRFLLLSFVAVCSSITVLLLLFFIKETHTPTATTQPAPNTKRKATSLREVAQQYQVAAKDKRFMYFISMMLVLYSFEYQTRNYSAVRLVNEVPLQPLLSWGHFHFLIDGYKLFALLNTVNTILVVVLGVFVAKWIKGLSTRTRQYSGLFLCALGYAFIAWNSRPWLLLLMMGVATIGELISVPGSQAMLADIVPDDKRGSYMAVNGLTYRVASFVGSTSVTVGAFVPSWAMGLEVFASGLLGIFLCSKVLASTAVLQKPSATPATLDT